MTGSIPRVNRPLSAEEIATLVARPDPLIVEIGSHDGTDTKRFRAAMAEAEIHCFEIEARAISRFEEAMGHDKHVHLYKVAASYIDGECLFYPSTGKVGQHDDWDFSGSLNMPTGHYSYSPEISFKRPVSVNCIRLDTWYRAVYPEECLIDFIWADVQGAQMKLVCGAYWTFHKTRYLYIECHERPLYEEEPSQADLVAVMRCLGYEPVGVYDLNNILFVNRKVAA